MRCYLTELVVGGRLKQKLFTGKKFNFDNAKKFCRTKIWCVCLNFVSERETTWRVKFSPLRAYFLFGFVWARYTHNKPWGSFILVLRKRACKPVTMSGLREEVSIKQRGPKLEINRYEILHRLDCSFLIGKIFNFIGILFEWKNFSPSRGCSHIT